MREKELKTRTKQYGLRVIHLVQALPGGKAGEVIGRQLLRSGTSVGANYRAACRARSAADFAAKMALVEEEADESLYWLEMIQEAGLMKANRLEALMQESEEILSIAVSSIKTTKRNKPGLVNLKSKI